MAKLIVEIVSKLRCVQLNATATSTKNKTKTATKCMDSPQNNVENILHK